MLRKITTTTIFLLIFVYCRAQEDLCAERQPQKLSNAIDDCRPHNTTAKVCNDRGECICGFCVCFYRPDPAERIYGKYCECDNYSCDRAAGKLCSGHGVCDCGACRCFDGWTGTACECNATTLTCIDPQNREKKCNDHGDCLCGECHCHADEHGKYVGKYCESYTKYENSTEVNN
ncbi:hypothetical protein KPH14_005498 [Odynerus spinipes]|uniref:Integrin beta epidermal growth factor-like domain-containing protein n=1 Tax=Odynerus spinipes TaxID=1348599 RepID=A0AAD9VJC7_9HYME|nr:hypothetical protein KPH14_005498 [Odynerus spinipes]